MMVLYAMFINSLLEQKHVQLNVSVMVQFFLVSSFLNQFKFQIHVLF